MPMEDNTQLYNTLNNYFPTDEDIQNVIEFKKTKTLPSDVNTTRKSKRYTEKYKDFYVTEANELKFRPLNLLVVPKKDTEKVLNTVYETDDSGLGKAIVALYMFVRRNFLNITRNEVRLFIVGKTNYQLTKDFKNRSNKPVISKFPQQIWSIDLIDMSYYKTHNKNWRYILTVVDVFSRKIWLEKLKDKEGKTVADVLKHVFERAGVAPRHVLSDNGAEFIGELMVKMLKENDVKQRLTRTYSPMANGVTERANREVRKIIRAYMAKNGNNVWYDILRNVEENKNQTYHSLMKTFPDNVWEQTRDPIHEENDISDEDEDLLASNSRRNKQISQIKARDNVKKRVQFDLKRFKDSELIVGDFVRVKMTAISSNLRSLEKADKTKQIVIRYSPMIFKITKKITPRQGTLERSRYFVSDLQGRPLYVKRLTNRTGNSDVYTKKQFYSNDLLLIPSNKNGTKLTLEKAMKLNGVEPNLNDLTFITPDAEKTVRPRQKRRKPPVVVVDAGENPDLPRRTLRNVNYNPTYWTEEEEEKKEEPNYEPEYWWEGM
jgi:hypothetical protein